MKEPKNCDNPTKSPVIQEIIMSNRIGAIAVLLRSGKGREAFGNAFAKKVWQRKRRYKRKPGCFNLG